MTPSPNFAHTGPDGMRFHLDSGDLHGLRNYLIRRGFPEAEKALSL